jgi:hypothetical protein
MSIGGLFAATDSDDEPGRGPAELRPMQIPGSSPLFPIGKLYGLDQGLGGILPDR